MREPIIGLFSPAATADRAGMTYRMADIMNTLVAYWRPI